MKPEDFAQVHTSEWTYLDNAATSLMPDAVLAATNEFETNYRSNVARGIYPWADKATQAFEEARKTIAHSLKADPSEIIFTAGATASLNLAADFVSQLLNPERKVILSELDHHSNIVPWQLRFGEQEKLSWLECDANARLRHDQLEDLLASGDYGAIALTHASNVTGEVIAIDKIAPLAQKAEALLIVDGAQRLPHSFVSPRALGADFYAFSSHKCNGPMGLGVLWVKAELLEKLTPPHGGGGMVVEVGKYATSFVKSPYRFEAGTPSVAAAIGLGKALQLRMDDNALAWEQNQTRIDELDTRLRQVLAEQDEISFISDGTNRGTPIVSFNLGNFHAHDVCQLLAQEQICARGGHHCAQPLMRRLGLDACVRLSLGPHVRKSDIDKVAPALTAVAKQLS